VIRLARVDRHGRAEDGSVTGDRPDRSFAGRAVRGLAGAATVLAILSLVGAPTTAARPDAAGTILGGIAGPSAAGARFPAIGESGISPADATIAVGRSSIVETTNTQIAIWSKTGAPVSSESFAAFFPGAVFCVDPRVIYWRWDDRFAMVCADNYSSPRVLRLAVSQTGDPTGAWNRYSIGAVTSSDGYDQPAVVATSDKLVISAFHFADAGDVFFVLQLSDLLRGVAAPRMARLVSNGYALNTPAVQATKTSRAYFVNLSSNNRVQLATITGTPATRVAMTVSDLGANSFAAPPATVPLPGGSMSDPPDGRAMGAVYEVETSDHKAVIQFGASAGCDGQVCNGIGRIQLDPTPGLLYQITSGDAGYDDTFGNVGLNDRGDWFVSYSRSNASQAPQAVLRSASFEQLIQDAAPGATACPTTTPCTERWGDYVNVAQDPITRSHVWAVGEYQADNGVWATVIEQATSAGVIP
jgi:hypothetical protein